MAEENYLGFENVLTVIGIKNLKRVFFRPTYYASKGSVKAALQYKLHRAWSIGYFVNRKKTN